MEDTVHWREYVVLAVDTLGRERGRDDELPAAGLLYAEPLGPALHGLRVQRAGHGSAFLAAQRSGYCLRVCECCRVSVQHPW